MADTHPTSRTAGAPFFVDGGHEERGTAMPTARRPSVRLIKIAASAHAVFLFAAVIELARLSPPWYGTAFAATGIVLFAVCFVRIVWRNMERLHQNVTPVAFAAMVGTAAALQVVLERTWLLTASYYVVTLLVVAQPPRRWAPGVAAVLVAGTAAGVLRLGNDLGDAVATMLPVLGYAVILAFGYWFTRMGAELRRARIDLARGAVSAERTRIARDLHDVLGQRLTEIVLKAELASRLVGRDPERAAAEMSSVGRAARAALDEMRSTVSGYRDVTLAGEIATAGEIAKAAGIALSVHVPPALPGGAAGRTLAWAVREGLTNVLRHAEAGSCVITVTGSDPVVVTVTDDGPARRGGRARGEVAFGTGLAGLAERVTAAGGRLSASAGESRFTLRAEVPARAPDDSPSGTPPGSGRDDASSGSPAGSGRGAAEARDDASSGTQSGRGAGEPE
ncbi:hypothetical protein ITP53_20215 [Nonomuraea sp. K274]|uniref:Signal transduction histidine kinase subgroup 3 dimerisation and phosphoacceptor domain-containing protein n=1 Tax=Nonomuraea cypriaca TaxID=1187855 RepID=A0A931F1Z6_9ACTN|nr:histidine kinase [Nonomuraea cypriaca]MBF8188018.1 hypothetical protein [Nonomuraea cypriaca]